MMKLSTKCRYGLRALIHVAREYGNRAVKRKEISALEGISEGYLENLLVNAKAAGLVSTTRGANGGYKLSHPPEEIRVLDIVEVLEGEVAPVDCLINHSYCDRVEECVTQKIWSRVKEAVEEILGETTLKDLVEDIDRLDKKR